MCPQARHLYWRAPVDSQAVFYFLQMGGSARSRLKRLLIQIFFLILFGEAAEASSGVPPPSSSPTAKPTRSRRRRRKASVNSETEGTFDFQAKVLLVIFGVFMLIFVIVLMLVGHFTWFADIQEQLEKEWEEVLKTKTRDEESKIEKGSKMGEPPFFSEAKAMKMSPPPLFEEYGRECGNEFCIGPHHSILCPKNPNVPSLHEPMIYLNDGHLKKRSVEEEHNLEIKASTSSTSFKSTPLMIPTPLSINRTFSLQIQASQDIRPPSPFTPDPSPQEPSIFTPASKFMAQDLESGQPARSSSSSPHSVSGSSSQRFFDVSKLDLI